MVVRSLGKRLLRIVRGSFVAEHSTETTQRGPVCHVIILDGTMSSLDRGRETHAGLTYKLCREMNGPVSVFYEAGVQWTSWRETADVLVGKGINRQIRRAYGYLASRYKPGDRIYLMGYSRGAYAVRSLAGVLQQVGLLTQKHATERNILTAYRHYQHPNNPQITTQFRDQFCHATLEIDMVGVWDTVKALGWRIPIWGRWRDRNHTFHDHKLGSCVKNGFHALGLDETRQAFTPVLWESSPEFKGRVAQVWFRGTHGDVGGQLGGREEARPLANLSLVWMLARAEGCGLRLPLDWRMRFPVDPNAPSIGSWAGWSKVFFIRAQRRVGNDPSERIHGSAAQRKNARTQVFLGACQRLWKRGVSRQ